MSAYNKPVRIFCKAGSVSVRLVFESRAKCQDFIARCKDDGIPCEIDSLFAASKQLMLSANPDVRSPARHPVVPCTALWLRCNQSILVQEAQSAKDIDLICFKTFPIKAATCLQVGPMSLDWLVDPFARFDHSRLSLFLDISSGEHQQRCFSSLHSFPLEAGCSSSTTANVAMYWRVGWMWPFAFRRHAMYYLEHQRSHWICFIQPEQRIQYLSKVFVNNNIVGSAT